MNAGNEDMTPDRPTSTARELNYDGSAVTPTPLNQGMASPKHFTPNQPTVALT